VNGVAEAEPTAPQRVTPEAPDAPPSSGLLLTTAVGPAGLIDSRLLSGLADARTGSVGDVVELHPEAATAAGIASGDRVRLRSDHGEIELVCAVRDDLHPRAVGVTPGAWGAVVDPSAEFTALDVALVSAARKGAESPPPAVGRRGPVQPAESPQPGAAHEDRRWVMAVDLDACVGCAACTVACAVENNIAPRAPGGADPFWISIVDEPDAGPTPHLCQHCGDAPCEKACPTMATYHTAEGLNATVQERCEGMRYCERRCPYEVRQFNKVSPDWHPRELAGLNPDVAPRFRGLTEKCTFCVQRHRAARDQAAFEDRSVTSADIVPACVQACPTQALHFGDVLEADAAIAGLVADERAYTALAEAETKPGVVYLARRDA